MSIVFGSLGTLGALFGLISSGKPMFMPPNLHGSGMLKAFEDFHEATRHATLILSLLMTAMSIALIVIGTGQLKYRRWAAGASVKWAIAGFVVLAVTMVLQVAIISPATNTLMKEMSADMPFSMGGISGMTNVLAFVGLAIRAVYPLLLLLTFRKPAIVAAMQD